VTIPTSRRRIRRCVRGHPRRRFTGATAFYPHRLELLGPSHSFGFTQRLSQLGPIITGDVTYETDVRLSFDEIGASYHVCVPLRGWFESRHRGQQLTSTPALGSIYRPDAPITVTRWPTSSRQLAVKIDRLAIDNALASLIDEPMHSPIAFDPSLPIDAGAARDWVLLLTTVSRGLECPDSIVRHPLVSIPLVESLIHGFLLVENHPYRDALAAPTNPARPSAVREQQRGRLPHPAARSGHDHYLFTEVRHDR
jgi:AraC-binding-like domain